jgi:hypothetical protein
MLMQEHLTAPVLCAAFSSNLKMKATCSSKTSIGLQRTIWRYILHDSALHSGRCENLTSYSTAIRTQGTTVINSNKNYSNNSMYIKAHYYDTSLHMNWHFYSNRIINTNSINYFRELLTYTLKFHGLSPRTNYTDRATAACQRSDCQLLQI